MTNKIYILDAMGLAFRAYYAIRAALTDSRGRPTNAVYGAKASCFIDLSLRCC